MKTVKSSRALSGARSVICGLTALMVFSLPTSVQANMKFGSQGALAEVLSRNGFETLKFALDTTNLTPLLAASRVTIFAPTDDVFEVTAQALGCTDAVDLASRLLALPVGESDALSAVLSYHAHPGPIWSVGQLLRMESLSTLLGTELVSGVDTKGAFVQGEANGRGSTITVDGIKGARFVIYPIDQILLPFAPPEDLCS